MRNTANNAIYKVFIAIYVRVVAGDRAEAEGVQTRDGTRAHGEDVAQNPADTGRRALERLDGGRVVVGLHLEDDAPAGVAERHDARVLQRAGLLGFLVLGERLQDGAGVLIAAVLAPHDGVHAQLGVGRDAA